MRRFCTHRTGAGEMHRRPFFGAARFFESFRVWRKFSPKSPDSSRRGNAELDTSNMVGRKRACCSSPAAMCYWFAASLIAWGVLSVVGAYWHPLHWYSASTTLFAMAMGCVANWLRNRSFHCAITGPLFLIAGIFFLFADLAHRSRKWAFGVVAAPHRNGRGISPGMAVCEALLLDGKRLIRRGEMCTRANAACLR